MLAADGVPYIHIKSGTEYRLILVTNTKGDKDRTKFVPTAVYVDKQFRVWSRPLAEFIEKFKEKK